jgi:hypothetical protein
LPGDPPYTIGAAQVRWWIASDETPYPLTQSVVT